MKHDFLPLSGNFWIAYQSIFFFYSFPHIELHFSDQVFLPISLSIASSLNFLSFLFNFFLFLVLLFYPRPASSYFHLNFSPLLLPSPILNFLSVILYIISPFGLLALFPFFLFLMRFPLLFLFLFPLLFPFPSIRITSTFLPFPFLPFPSFPFPPLPFPNLP